ncbi:hypothetical protein BXZ70DRAFT_1009156 [Cristinia sonorae]|uniref:Uncharacterized protein n=1 Tax=Cristinia sonorae TaxID=1940300 RepID=A0A8K0UMB3_9AGAR|nr:hypothetical protein BXZ70DRAFT_1009156 [Cristinia sonorae]
MSCRSAIPGTERCSNPELAVPFVVLHILGGHVCLPILTLTFIFSKNCSRPLNVINVCITWTIFSVSYCLLIYTGHLGGTKPPFALCLTQAAMTQGSPPMTGVAVLIMVIQMWLSFSPDSFKWFSNRISRLPNWIRNSPVFLPPYLVYISICAATASYGLKHPETVRAPSGLYCTIEAPTFDRALPFAGVAFIGLILIVDICKMWRYIAHGRLLGRLSKERSSLSLWARVLAFNLCNFAAISACLVLLFDNTQPAPYIIVAALPLMAALIFGTHPTALRELKFWKRNDSKLNLEHPTGSNVGSGSGTGIVLSTNPSNLEANVTPNQSIV